MWSKTKEYFQHPIIQSALIMGLATGISIIATAWAFKKVIQHPVPTGAQLFMAAVLCGYTVGQAYRKKIPWMGKAWIWASVVLLATAGVIVYNIIKYS